MLNSPSPAKMNNLKERDLQQRGRLKIKPTQFCTKSHAHTQSKGGMQIFTFFQQAL
jgi:hypothetical protein